MKIEYAFIVKNETKLEQLVNRFRSEKEAQLYIENLGDDFQEYQKEHDNFYALLEELKVKLSPVLAFRVLDRKEVKNYFPKNSLVIVFGDETLVAYTSRYTTKIPIIGVSLTMDTNESHLLPFNKDNFIDGVKWVMINNYDSVKVNLIGANLNNGQRLLAFHDLYIGSRSPRSARYQISFNEHSEIQRSSGVIVSTKAGLKEWSGAIFNMAYGITNTFQNKQKYSKPRINYKHLIFAVREPCNNTKTELAISAGLMYVREQLIIESHMLLDGVIYGDGIEEDFIAFNKGTKVSISLSNTYSNLVRNVKLPPGFMDKRRAFRRD